MKKQLIALLTIPVLALTSCNSSKYSLEEVLNFATEKVNTFTNPESVYSKYSVVGEGHVVEYDCDPTYSKKTIMDINYSKDEEGVYSLLVSNNSLFLRLPMIVESGSFNTNVVVGFEDSKEVYASAFDEINAILSSTIDKSGRINAEETEDGGIHFYTRRCQFKQLNLYNVDSTRAISVTSRFDIDLYYNNYGLLVKETVKSDNRVSNAKDKTVALTANYTYSN